MSCPSLASLYARYSGRVVWARTIEAGLFQEKLALEAGVDRTFVSLLERGGRQPILSTLWKPSEALGVSPSELVTGVERTRRPARR